LRQPWGRGVSKPNLFHKDDGWLPHATSRCPVHAESVVRVQWRKGALSLRKYHAKDLVWSQRDLPFDVVAYRVLKEAGE
jgi:hypothetical protein